MKKFFFRLETLLKVRKVRESRLLRDLKIAEQKLAQVREKKETLEQQISSLMEEISEKRKSNEISLQDTYTQILDHLNSSLDQVAHDYEGQQRQVDEHKARVKQAVQERKLIEKIKDKHYSSWRSQSEQEDEEFLDEVAINQSHSNS